MLNQLKNTIFSQILDRLQNTTQRSLEDPSNFTYVGYDNQHLIKSLGSNPIGTAMLGNIQPRIGDTGRSSGSGSAIDFGQQQVRRFGRRDEPSTIKQLVVVRRPSGESQRMELWVRNPSESFMVCYVEGGQFRGDLYTYKDGNYERVDGVSNVPYAIYQVSLTSTGTGIRDFCLLLRFG
ncbi:MAG: hypothetical protein WCD18_08035, partial [Thermosynechococcaceae cyanobacterium]